MKHAPLIPAVAVTIISLAAMPHSPDPTHRLGKRQNPAETVVTQLDISQSRTGVTLRWSPLPDPHPATGQPLVGYRIYEGDSPDELHPTASTDRTVHHFTTGSRCSFYRVTGVYGERRAVTRLRRPVRDDIILLDFEEDIDLESFPGEDVDTAAWELTDEDALNGEGRSLLLSGNCWKILEIEPLDIADSSVWSLGVKSVDGDTMADLQAFGFGDGDNRLFYTFHGQRLYWEVPWVVTYQDMHPRGDWQVYRMAVGYDWNIRYEYLPEITEFYFINDNDSLEDPAVVYFDELTDITASVPRDPVLNVRWNLVGSRFAPQFIGAGSAVAFSCRPLNREAEDLLFRWDFGDGRTGEGAAPVHHYRRDDRYTASVTAVGDDGTWGRAAAHVVLGEQRFPGSLQACFTGDVMLARRYESENGIITRFGPEAVFERVRERLTAADLCFINLESVLTDEGEHHPTKSYYFRGSPENVAGLTYAGVDIASLANNHVHDYGRRGLEETMEVLSDAGIGFAGAGLNESEALRPVFRTVNGVVVGMLGYCNRTGRDSNRRPVGDAGYDKFGFAYFSADNLQRSVPRAAELCDQLVVYVHGGTEYATYPTALAAGDEFPPWSEERLRVTAERDSATRELEHMAIDLGADLVIGGHPHVLQGFEVYRGAVIAHSLGNFAFDQNFFETWTSVLVRADIHTDSIPRVWLEPMFVDNYLPTPARGELGTKILDRLAGYSTELGTMLVPDYDIMVCDVVLDERRLLARESEFQVEAELQFVEDDGVYRSAPLPLDGNGFPYRLVSIESDTADAEWTVYLGRDILLVGNMEDEGADIWNYNSDWEGVDTDVAHRGERSSYLHRPAHWQDGITDIKQRIPVTWDDDRLTLAGWLRTENARDGGLAARFYRYRYSNDPRHITGEQTVGERLQGDNDWTLRWGNLTLPEDTWFLNVRWQLFGPDNGEGWLWADDVQLIRWEPAQIWDGSLDIPAPDDIRWVQLETGTEVEQATVTYRTITFTY